MKFTGENWRTRGKACPSATLSTTNPTWTDPGSNPGLRGGRPAANRLSHGTAYVLVSLGCWSRQSNFRALQVWEGVFSKSVTLTCATSRHAIVDRTLRMHLYISHDGGTVAHVLWIQGVCIIIPCGSRLMRHSVLQVSLLSQLRKSQFFSPLISHKITFSTNKLNEDSLLWQTVCRPASSINPLKTKRNLQYIKTLCVPRCKLFQPRL
jgi:hypothetical protein